MSNYSTYKIVRQRAFIIDTHLRNPYFHFVDSDTTLRIHSCYKVRTTKIREEKVDISELPSDVRNHFYYLLSKLINKS